jgi:hypothetical protein
VLRQRPEYQAETLPKHAVRARDLRSTGYSCQPLKPDLRPLAGAGGVGL